MEEMRSAIKYILLFAMVAGTGLTCTKPYNPSVVAGNNNYLVVEGNINTGTDSTIIRLSRTTNIASGITSLPEQNANVTIQDNQNGSYILHSSGSGIYTSALITLDPTRMYRLSITTSDGKNYLSDYVPAVASPPIDSVGYLVQSKGLQVYVNTHDPNNATHYYRWDYDETWEFHAKYFSSYITTGTQIVVRTPAQNIYYCWTSDISTDIELASSAKLSQDVIYQAPIVSIPSTSEKIGERYSILVKQYAMTSAGYNYYSLLKQNTEELGSIFDAQPSTLTGNIHCTSNPTIPAIGYVTAGTVAQKRIYIDYSTLPSSYVTTYPYDCSQDTALYYDPRYPPNQTNRVALLLLPLNSQGVITQALTKLSVIIGYLYSDPACADCTIRGSTTPPSFWQYGAYDN